MIVDALYTIVRIHTLLEDSKSRFSLWGFHEILSPFAKDSAGYVVVHCVFMAFKYSELTVGILKHLLKLNKK